MQPAEEQNALKWTIREILTWTTNRFKQAHVDTPLLDAQLLLCKVLNTEKINLYMDLDKPLTPEERSNLRSLVKRRLCGEPVAYILQEKYWHNLKLYVDNRVLIPRPETECLLDFVIDSSNKFENINTENISSIKIIYDFCTGSGCLAIALAKLFPQAIVVGIDISQDALHVAKHNAQLNNATNIHWHELDLTQHESFEFLKQTYGHGNIIVANPPYVSEDEYNHLDISVKNYEPKIALTAKDNGLFIGQKILANISILLNKKMGIFAMEMAHGHPQQLVTENIKSYLFNSSLGLEFEKEKLNKWFAFCDYDQKSRFLCFISSCL